jgi:hypothetical protein
MSGLSAVASRTHYYDRGATPTEDQYSASGVTPHAVTIRWGYTVPTAKKAYCEFVKVWVRRATAAAAAGRVTSSLKYTPDKGIVSTLVIARTTGNAVDSADRDGGAVGAFMAAGDQAEGQTEDLSTGGTVDYVVLMKRAEFDA